MSLFTPEQCISLATPDYNCQPATLQEFLKCVNNPEDVINLFHKTDVSVIFYRNDPDAEHGFYAYFLNIKAMMDYMEGSVQFQKQNFEFQHCYIVNRAKDLLESELVLVVSKDVRRNICEFEDHVDYELINTLAHELDCGELPFD